LPDRLQQDFFHKPLGIDPVGSAEVDGNKMTRRKKKSSSSGTSLIRLLRMRPAQLFAALLLLSIAAVISLFLKPAEGQVLKVIDGDTIEVFSNGVNERVRLLGVDSPEVHHPQKGEEPFGREAADFTRRSLLGLRIKLEIDPLADDRDRYGRLLRVVLLPDGSDFNALLVREGMARAMREFPFSRKSAYVALEEEARQAGRGMWGDAE
jgi:endonuclease YncB( thermonuclease family)